MALEYNIYLDNTLISDIPDGMSDFELTVIREGDITSDDQVLRTKTEAELSFWGDGYAYICSAKQENYCQNINVRIYIKCDSYSRLAFIGLLPLVGTQADPTRGIIKTRIRDNSFSGIIRERQNNKVFLSATKSANGNAISSCPVRTIDFFTSAGAYSYTNRNVYDVYDVLKWLIKYLSDDTVSVSSYYFTSGTGYKRYALTIGGMLYGGIGWAGQTSLPRYFIPEVTFAEVFRELRKKLRIYMSVDIDANGKPTVRIEPESYFYSNTSLKAITGIPFDLIESYDIEQVYSEIKVGSNDTKVDDGTFYTYPKLTLYGFENETYNSCSDCVEQNTLDLVSEWIIDSNVIHYTLGQAAPDSYANTDNGDKIFLIETNDMSNLATKTAYDANTYYYNNTLTNDQVLTNWAGGIPECVSKYFYDLCVDACAEDISIADPGISITATHPLEFTITEDCLKNMFTDTFDFTFTSGTTYAVNNGDTGSYFVAPASGTYNFTFISDIIASYSSGTYISELVIAAFSNSANLTSSTNITSDLIDIYTNNTASPLTSSTITVNASLNLTEGNVVVFLRWTDLNLYTGTLKYDDPCIKLTSYNIAQAFNFVSDDYLRKPLLWEFTDNICEEDFIGILEDKSGFISINGKRGWIKEINYKAGKISAVILQSTESLCC